MTTILWFRRDLRLTDHPAMVEAARDDAVLPVVVLDPSQLDGPNVVARDRFLAGVEALREAMGGDLVIRIGDPREVIPDLVRAVGARAVHASRDHGPRGERRDAEVAARLTVPLVHTGSQYAVSPDRIGKADGSAYRVFTPFLAAWLRHGWRPPAPTVHPRWVQAPSEDSATFRARSGIEMEAGEARALARWQTFREDNAYASRRDRPDLDGTTRLSAALRFGEIHPRTMLAGLGDEPGDAKLRSELAWREFAGHLLHHFPHTVSSPMDSRFEGMRWDVGPDADARFEAWREGRTGFPFVDAGMRQLRDTGWMHNRVRMVAASFLVKHLHIDWRRGAGWFAERLADFDLASNTLGWQWTAGCGADAAPYHRVFNPVLQGQRFDPDGDFVRAYVPELHHLPGATVHEPWRAALAAGYPPRIIDLDVERREALARLREIRGGGAE